MLNWILETLVLLVSAAGVFLGFVSTLYLLQRLVCGMATREFGGKAVYLSAIIGTPIHEISHAVMCIPFRHKILEVKLFQPDGAGTLGYVNHSYNPMSIWQQIGNFFIGMAPLVGGTFTIYLLTALLLPYGENVLFLLSDPTTFANVTGATTFAVALLSQSQDIAIVLQTSALENPGKFALWAYLTAAISLHLSPSPADMKGSVVGFLVFLSVIAAVRFISATMGERFFDGVASTMLSLSMTYTLCVLLASGLAVIIFALSLIKTH